MLDGVQYQMWAIEINEGDCILSNHQCAEGVYLPVYSQVTAILMLPGDFARCSGTHNLHGNLADLRALVAANQKVRDPPGPGAYIEILSSYELEVVQAYMAHIQHHAEVADKNLLRDISKTTDGVLRESDKMDDGSVINLRVEVDSKEGSATFDFEGTFPMVINNLNAPRAFSKSAIIYSFRCMVGYDVPLNLGYLAPIHVNIPKWSLLDPYDDAAVVGGNVLTSQRMVDVIFKAFKACAASQGCLNRPLVMRALVITKQSLVELKRDQPGTVAVGFTIT
ncbi:unnamed protein product [Clavelina lepadiformis]|uniref:Hydantoinase B/oxoprolinase domain-containing protein n=1 Tax=Clavelina lepadiformis TaxID=159417 RepID=A0ABP0G8X9_CLALP